ncbi:MAG TPA: glycoside hydrolase family 3 N-terminal domain-containing protein [Gemmatimonadales bacterium]|nr:glycoside hydrolase family 3 N-terminal domain-containing protein [Gemmatimonadales bacterium]
MHRSSLAALAVSVSALTVACAPAVRAPASGLSPAQAGWAHLSTDRILDSLSLRDRVAQLVWPWVDGTYTAYDAETYTRTVAMWVDTLHVGGVLVSIGSPLDIAAKLNDLQRRSPLPLLVGSDLESGTSFRFVGGTPTPPNMAVGADGRELDAYELGRLTALEGRAVGVHIAFAPVADVNDNPLNPVINTRSFGGDPKAVGTLVAAAVRGIQDHGMLAVAKHFPGHGNTDTDTHLALPAIPGDWARLDSVELVPFRQAIDAGVGGVMTAHIVVPSLEQGAHRPATMSPPILTGVLRDSLGFKGLVITDALNMGSLVNNFPGVEPAIEALLAGADVLLQPADPKKLIDGVTAAVASGRVPEARLNEAVRRVLELKRRFGLFARRTVALDSIPAVVGDSAFQRLADQVAARAIVLARDSTGVVDSLRARPSKLALVTFGDERSPAIGLALSAELRARGYGVSLFRLWPNSGPASYDSARAVLASAPSALFAVAVRAYPWHANRVVIPDAMAALIDDTADERPAALVSLGSPYVSAQVPCVTSYLLGWISNPTTERAVARALSGAPITGTLPIHVAPDLPLGAGLQRPGIGRFAERADERPAPAARAAEQAAR